MENKQVMPMPSQHVIDEMRLDGAHYYNEAVYNGMWKLAKTLLDAKAVPQNLNSEAKIVVVLQAGRETGISPISALNSFYIVNGNVKLWGDSAIGLVLRDGHQIDWGKCDANEATVTITRGDNGKSMTGKFTFAEAEQRGLTKYSDGRLNEFWRKFPDNMLKFKAFGSIAKFIVADSLRGMSIKEEHDAGGMDYRAEVINNERPMVTAPVAVSNSLSTPAVGEVVGHEEEDESASLNQYLENSNKPKLEEPQKRKKDDIVKDINAMITNAGKDPVKVLEHYKKSSWNMFKVEELLKIEESVKISLQPKEPAIAEPINNDAKPTPITNQPKSVENIPTYYMPEEEVMALVDELMTVIESGQELTQQQMDLVNDVSNNQYAGKASPRYAGAIE